MTTPTTITESELFRQFLESEILAHTFTGKVFGSTPVRSFLDADNETLNEFLEQIADDAAGDGAQSTDVLVDGIGRLMAATDYLKAVSQAFAQAREEQTADHGAGFDYHPLTSTDPTEAEIGADLERQGGVGFIAMTNDDEQHIRRG